ncbi:CopL family metal-binding regulatory protein [Luteimonas huabeiensis]|uniref:CopL family metal-binding regulatory protein n=1 Tax=Luteimonas huabeiensis TaxID=1244513 RepID=UPI000464CF87|nr:CopL family metal-binding regulatory protein [Luteimonas huabeiensis]
MHAKPALLRVLLSLLLCLNGSTALWASAGMALAPGHLADHAGADQATGASHGDHGAPVACAGSDPAACLASAADAATADDHRHADGERCDCGAGMIAGCACNCAYPAGTIDVTVPFAGRHALRSEPPLHVEILAPQRGSGKIFRPPIS